jgi:hypothetical protein
MSAHTSKLSISFDFPASPAAELIAGDLLHLGSLTFVLITHVVSVDGWLHVTLYDPERPGSGPHLSYRPEHEVRIAHRGIHPPDPGTDEGWDLRTGPTALPASGDGDRTMQPDAEVAPDALGDQFVDLDRIAALVRAAGVACIVDVADPHSGAALLAGPPTFSPAWAYPWSAYAGPAMHTSMGSTYAATRTLAIGPHDGGDAEPIMAEVVGATTHEQIADLIVAQSRKPHGSLTNEELLAINLRPRDH